MKYILLSFLQLIAAVLFNLYSQTRPDQIINISNSPVSSLSSFVQDAMVMKEELMVKILEIWTTKN